MPLRLASTFDAMEDFENPQFDLRAKDDDHDDVCSLQDFPYRFLEIFHRFSIDVPIPRSN